MAKIVEADVAPVDAFVAWLDADRCVNAGQRHLNARPGTFLHHLQSEKHWVIADAIAYLAARNSAQDWDALIRHRFVMLTRLAYAKRDLDTELGGRATVPGRFANQLLGDEGPNYVHELISAAGHLMRGCPVEWLQERSGLGEFSCDVGTGRAVHVECKRLLSDAMQYVKDAVAAEIGDAIADAVAQRNLSGTVLLKVGPNSVGKPRVLEAVRELSGALGAGDAVKAIADIEMTSALQEKRGEGMPSTQLVSASPDRYVLYARSAGAALTIAIEGAQREEAWLDRKVIDVAAETAADSQLPEDRPGLVCLEIPFFAEAEYLDKLAVSTRTLFERPHVIGLIATVRTVAHAATWATVARSPARIYVNPGTRFEPERDAWQARWK